MMKDPNVKDTKQQNKLGLDADEQKMNGLYGMAETMEEDTLNSQNKQQKM